MQIFGNFTNLARPIPSVLHSFIKEHAPIEDLLATPVHKSSYEIPLPYSTYIPTSDGEVGLSDSTKLTSGIHSNQNAYLRFNTEANGIENNLNFVVDLSTHGQQGIVNGWQEVSLEGVIVISSPFYQDGDNFDIESTEIEVTEGPKLTGKDLNFGLKYFGLGDNRETEDYFESLSLDCFDETLRLTNYQIEHCEI